MNGAAVAGGPATIVVGPAAPVLERFAAAELSRALTTLFGFTPAVRTTVEQAAGPLFLLGCPQTNPGVGVALGTAGWPVLSDQGLLLRTVSLAGQPALVIGGGSPVATLWAVYTLLEHYGVRFLLHGDVFPPAPEPFHLPDLSVQQEPDLRIRAWRGMNDFTMGPESWGLDDYRRFIDQLAKLRFNMLFLSLWPWHPFVHYEFRGVRKTTGVLWFGWRYPLEPDAIGREHFGNAAEFTNPAFQGCQTYEERLAAGQRLLHGILAHAHARGLETVITVPLTDYPQEFKDAFERWGEAAAPAGVADREATEEGLGTPHLSRLGVAMYGTDPRHAQFQDVDNPLLLELATTVLRASIETYPEADYYLTSMPEFRTSITGYERCWRRLDAKYDLEAIAPLADLMAHARQRYFSSSTRAAQELAGDIEGLYFLDKLFTEARALERTAKPEACVLLSHITEELFPVLPRAAPWAAGFHLSVDYTASRVVRRQEVLGTLPAHERPCFLVLTLQDDNIGVLPQLPTDSLHQLVGALREHGWTGFFTRHWLLGDLEPSAAYLARAAWDTQLTPEAAYTAYLRPWCGEAALPETLAAFRLLEETTRFNDQEAMGMGFPVPRWMMRHWQAGEPLPPALRESQRRYREALALLRRAQEKARPQGQEHLAYFLGRLEFAVQYVDLLAAVREAGMAYRAADEVRQQGDAARYGALLEEAAAGLAAAVALARATLGAWARVVRDQSDRGALAAMNEYIYKYLKAQAHIVRLEASQWRL